MNIFQGKKGNGRGKGAAGRGKARVPRVTLMETTSNDAAPDPNCTPAAALLPRSQTAAAIGDAVSDQATHCINPSIKAKESLYQKMTKHIDVPQGKRKARGAGAHQGLVDNWSCRSTTRMSTRRTPGKEWESPPAETCDKNTKKDSAELSCGTAKVLDMASRDLATPCTTNKAMEVYIAEDTGVEPSRKKARTWKALEAKKSKSVAGSEKKVAEVQLFSECKIQPELNCPLELQVFEAHLDAVRQLSGVQTALTNSQTELEDCRKRILQLQAEVQEKTVLIEKLNAAQNAKAADSGSYAEDHANPSILQEAAYQSVYMAVMQLGKTLVEYAPVAKGCSQYCQRASRDLQRFFCTEIGPGVPVDLGRPVQMKHAWGHRICRIMFLGFDHISFQVPSDREDAVEALDLKTLSAERYRSYLQLKDVSASEMFRDCRKFCKFCVHKYRVVFTREVVFRVLHYRYTEKREISRDGQGRFAGDGEIFHHFLDVAKTVWLLHHLAFSFDPPASIFRMDRVTLYDARYHDPGYEEKDDVSQAIPFIVTPTLRVRNTIIRSRVYLPETSSVT